MVGQVAVSPIGGSTTTDYVVHNAVLHCFLSGEGVLPSRSPGCECPLDIRSWLTHCSDQLSYRPFDLSFCRHAASPKAPTVGGLKARLVTYHLYAPGARLNPALPGDKNPASGFNAGRILILCHSGLRAEIYCYRCKFLQKRCAL